MKTPKFKPTAVARAIRDCSGLLSFAARSLGISREALYGYVERYPVCKRAVQEARDVVLDVAEAELMKKIRAGDLSAINMTLKTLGKSRGYVERQEVRHEGEVTNNVKLTVYLPDNGRDRT